MLDFEVVKSIDGKKHRIAKLKGNKILVQVNARRLPKSALRYIIAHEIAHTLTKSHTKRFWKILEAIYPSYETGQNLLMKYGRQLKGELEAIPD
jgi:predicted metal-dependent hydrolase